MHLILVFLQVKHWKAPTSALGEESNIMDIKENVHYRKEEMPGVRRTMHNLY